MTPREQEEYRALRATIRERGTTRVWLFGLGVAVWAALVVASVGLSLPPAATLVSLVVLGATFEAVLALHAGVERIGRYLLVFHADRWEQMAGGFGRPPGALAIDPLFTTTFLIAAAVNLLPLLAVGPVLQELVVVGVAHAAFVIRLVRARATAARQREVDSRRFEEIRQKS